MVLALYDIPVPASFLSFPPNCPFEDALYNLCSSKSRRKLHYFLSFGSLQIAILILFNTEEESNGQGSEIKHTSTSNIRSSIISYLKWAWMVLMGRFARINNNDIIVSVYGAENGCDIDPPEAQQTFRFTYQLHFSLHTAQPMLHTSRATPITATYNAWQKPLIIFLLTAPSVPLHMPKTNFLVKLHFRSSTHHCCLSQTLHLLTNTITNMSSQSSTASNVIRHTFNRSPIIYQFVTAFHNDRTSLKYHHFTIDSGHHTIRNLSSSNTMEALTKSKYFQPLGPYADACAQHMTILRKHAPALQWNVIVNGEKYITRPWYQFLVDSDFIHGDEISFYFRSYDKVWEMVIRR
ncbi:hypothetical protein JHK84_042957 [Glycine max]|nr:hypothetical protein JHK84_042957 [Glycine max]